MDLKSAAVKQGQALYRVARSLIWEIRLALPMRAACLAPPTSWSNEGGSRVSDGQDSTALLRCGISIWPMSAWGQKHALPRRGITVRLNKQTPTGRVHCDAMCLPQADPCTAAKVLTQSPRQRVAQNAKARQGRALWQPGGRLAPSTRLLLSRASSVAEAVALSLVSGPKVLAVF